MSRSLERAGGAVVIGGIAILVGSFLLRPPEADLSLARGSILRALETPESNGTIDAATRRAARTVVIHDLRGWQISQGEAAQASTREQEYVAAVEAYIDGQPETVYMNLTGQSPDFVPGCRLHTLGFQLARWLRMSSLASCSPKG
jgi:hypothetical protein